MRQFLIFFMLITASSAAQADGLFDALGGMDGVKHVAYRTIELSAKDPRIRVKFKRIKLARVQEKLTLQLCEIAGGPCIYDGDPMGPLHKAMKLTTADFNALVEAMQQAMREEGIGFSVQNKLVALLAPLHKVIVTVR